MSRLLPAERRVVAGLIVLSVVIGALWWVLRDEPDRSIPVRDVVHGQQSNGDTLVITDRDLFEERLRWYDEPTTAAFDPVTEVAIEIHVEDDCRLAPIAELRYDHDNLNQVYPVPEWSDSSLCGFGGAVAISAIVVVDRAHLPDQAFWLVSRKGGTTPAFPPVAVDPADL